MRERLTLDPMLRKQLRGVARRLEVSLPTLVDELLRESMRAFPARPPRTEHALRDAVFYRGPSVLTGAPIVGVVTGLDHVSLNPKTGPMLQTWILCADLAPMDAVRRNLDDAICGHCALRDAHLVVEHDPHDATFTVWMTNDDVKDHDWSACCIGLGATRESAVAHAVAYLIDQIAELQAGGLAERTAAPRRH